MTLYYAFDKSGGFVAGDTETGITCYSYPSSANAVRAKREPDLVAQLMISSESAYIHELWYAKQYDMNNWNKLAMLVL